MLYEIFTGKQAFTADSVSELIQKHRLETPTNPSEHVKGIDPLVESIIFQCLEKNADERPPSALHVAMALPGGNPLQVALDAGETPSPEMVAAAPKKGSLRPLIALSCVGGSLLMIAFIMAAAMKLAPQNRIPLARSPEILSDRAGEILAKLGYTDPPAESAYGFRYDEAYLNTRDKTRSGKLGEVIGRTTGDRCFW